MGNSRLQHTNSIILQADIRVVYAYFIELISQSHNILLVTAWFAGAKDRQRLAIQIASPNSWAH
jgi:hypothetical protein